MHSLVSTILAALILFAAPASAASPEQVAQDEAMLRAAGVATDVAGLMKFVRGMTGSELDPTRIKALVSELGDDRFHVRERATAQLSIIGPKAEPFLRAALSHRDPEVVARAQRCLTQIKESWSGALVAAAVRLLGHHKPPEATRLFLDSLAYVDQEYLAEEIHKALAELALRDGKPDPVLLAALTDEKPERRIAAAVALTKRNIPDVRDAVRKLLTDPKTQVRYRVALTLVAARQKEALHTLIKLIEDLQSAEIVAIDEILYRLAGESAPEAELGNTPEERRKYQAAWDAWYTANHDKIDLAKLEQARKPKGHTLVVLLNAGKVVDIDPTGKENWKVEGLQFPLDAQPLPDDRVLVAEYEGNRVTERNNKGEIVWEKKVTMPVVAQRLINGHTFIATPTQLLEVDRKGREVWTQPPPRGGRVMKALRLPNGDVACVTLLGTPRYYQIDREGKIVRHFGVELATSGGKLDVQPNGNILIPERGTDRVVELDSQGRQVWAASFMQPVAAVRLPNGNTLVTSMEAQNAVELDSKGKTVWEYKTDTRVTRAFRY